MDTPEVWFHRRATLYVEAQILFHLNQVGVFRWLNENGPSTAAQIAESLGIEPKATDALLDYVFEVDDVLERDGSRYALSDFGQKVIERFSKKNADSGERSINMFDVRVGAYGPVWQSLSKMLTGEARYGVDFHRAGQHAEDAVSKLAVNFWDSLIEHVGELGAESTVEVGLTTCLLERLGESQPNLALYGLDKNGLAIEKNAASAVAKGIENIRWIQSDYFTPGWWDVTDAKRTGLIYSLHFHELMVAGEEKFVEILKGLKAALPGWSVLAFEQPRLPHDAKAHMNESGWLYSQSNVLIHHLIGNGKILSKDAWMDLGRRAGCRKVTERACNYLGYRAFLFQL